MKKKIILVVLCLLLICFYSGSMVTAKDNAVYVSISGKDSNSGASKENALKTISAAVKKAEPGTVIYIAPGKYQEKIEITKSGTETAPIKLTALDKKNIPVVAGKSGQSDNYYDGALIEIEDASNIIIEDLEFTDFKTTAENPVPMAIHVSGDSDGVVIRECIIHDLGNYGDSTEINAHGILVSGDSAGAINNIVIEKNELYNLHLGSSESLVLNGNVDGFKVNYNCVHDNDNIGIDFIGYERTYTGEEDRARNGECIGNIVYNITSAKNPTYEGDCCADGIYVDGGHDILIKDNIVSNCDIGIETASEHKNKTTANVQVINNIIYGCKSYAGICFGGSGETNGTAVGITIKNNTVYGNANGIVIQQANDASNVITNNIIQNSSENNLEGTVGKNVLKDNIFDTDIKNNIKATLKFKDASNGDFSLIDNKQKKSYGSYGYQKEKAGVIPTKAPDPSTTPDPSITPKVTVTPLPSVTPGANVTPTSEAVLSKYKIDGKRNDWKKIKSLTSKGKITSVKVDSDEKNIYFCIRSKKMLENYQLYLNTDNKTKTGYVMKKRKTSGYEYMLENGKLYRSLKNNSSWDGQWEEINIDIEVVKSKNIYEIRIDKDGLDINKEFGFCFCELNSGYSIKNKAEAKYTGK